MKSFRSVLVAVLFDTIALVLATLLMRNLKAFDRCMSGSMMGDRWGKYLKTDVLEGCFIKVLHWLCLFLKHLEDWPNVRSLVQVN